MPRDARAGVPLPLGTAPLSGAGKGNLAMRFESSLIFLLAATLPVEAQWDSTPWTGGAIHYSGSFVLYPSAAGIQAFSATGQEWVLVSPPGATLRGQGESLVVTEEPGGLRAWSALRNDSAVVALPPGSSVVVTTHAAVAWDPTAGGNAVLHAYSPFTGAWTAIATAVSAAAAQPAAGGNVIAVRDGLGYHAYSARTGQWATLAVVGSGVPIPVGSAVYADLDGGPGVNPQQIAAFSGHRGAWTLSDPYTTITDKELRFGEQVASLRVKTADPARFSYSGYSAFHGEWVTSTTTHAYTGGAGSFATGNTLVIASDPGVASNYEAFGAASGAWSPLAGANLTLFGTGEDYALVRDTVSGAVHATSGLAAGGWTTAAIGGGATFNSIPDHAGLVHAGGQDWAYSAVQDAWSAPVTVPPGAKLATGEAVFGFYATGGPPQAYAARWSQWVEHPSLSASDADQIGAQGSTLVFAEREFSLLDALHVFDERMRRWAPPLPIGAIGAYKTFTYGGTVVATPPDLFAPNGAVYAWSGRRGDWSASAGVGPPLTAVTAYGDVAWFRDANHNLWAFGSRERTHVADDWPDQPHYQTSGSGPAGPARLRLAMRGEPAAEVLLLYAAIGLAPAPYAVPGVAGLAYLDPTGAFLVANLGVVDADGVLNASIPLSQTLPPGISVWFQTVSVNLGPLQAAFAGRAAQAWVF
jgi:hypothetical protein